MPESGFQLAYVLALGLGYLFGSIPFGLLLTRAAGLGDVRAIGSGNIGATNVLRMGNKKIAALTLLCDVLKGTAAVLAARWLWGLDAALAAGLGAFLGHLFPVWLGFKGGKGVATFVGLAIGFYWPAALAFAGLWLAVAYATRYSSLSALAASLLTPAVMAVAGHGRMALLFVLLTALIFIMHRANIARLLSGTESRIGAKG